MLHNLPLYLLAVLTINLLPGPDMLYIMSQSMSHGKRLGFAATLGISTGCLVHMFAVSIGLSSLIYQSAFAFLVVKYIGASYLLYLGITSLLKKHNASIDMSGVSFVKAASWKKIYLQGFFTNVLNPKVALFFLAFLPQFVSISSNYSVGIQIILLGLIFNFSGTIVNMLVAYFFGTAKHWIAANPVAVKVQQKLTGLILVGLGLRLASTGRSIT